MYYTVRHTQNDTPVFVYNTPRLYQALTQVSRLLTDVWLDEEDLGGDKALIKHREIVQINMDKVNRALVQRSFRVQMFPSEGHMIEIFTVQKLIEEIVN